MVKNEKKYNVTDSIKQERGKSLFIMKENQEPEKKDHISFREALFRGMTELLVIILGVLFFFLIYKIDVIFAVIEKILGILMPVILGAVIAYLLIPVDEYFEKIYLKYFGKHLKTEAKRKKIIRIGGVATSILLFLIILFMLIYLVVPQIYFNTRNLILALPGQVRDLMEWITEKMSDDTELSSIVTRIYQEAMNFLSTWVKTDMLDQLYLVIDGVLGALNVVAEFFIGIIIAVYLMISRETFMSQGKKVIYAFFNDEHAEMFIQLLKECNRIFGGFINGKLLDSLIIGILCFIGASLLQMPYSVLVAVIIGVTNVIPFFGPYIGAIPSTILIMLASPSKGLIFIVFILVLQQFDGNILGPKILGDSIGLSPFWIIFAILLGGGLFGIVGMLFGVPVFAVFYFLVKSFIDYRLSKKGKVID